MKSKSILLCASVLFLLDLVTIDQAKAIPVTYNYIGSPYTTTTAPGEPGFTLNDHLSATLTLDSATWGITLDHFIGFLIYSGPQLAVSYAGRVTTDSMGNIVAWDLVGSGPAIDEARTYGDASGSGRDGFARQLFVGGQFFEAAAEVVYPTGPRAPGTGWFAVPDRSSSLLLFSLALIPLLWFAHTLLGKRADL